MKIRLEFKDGGRMADMQASVRYFELPRQLLLPLLAGELIREGVFRVHDWRERRWIKKFRDDLEKDET